MTRVQRCTVSVLVCVVTIGALAFGLIPTLVAHLPGRHISVSEIQSELGLAYIGKLGDPDLSDHERLSATQLYLIETLRGSLLHRLDPLLAGSYAFEWFKSLYDANYPNATYEVRTQLGPPHASHADIRAKGGGQYSIWHGHIYFGLPQGKALADVTRLEVVAPLVPQFADSGSVEQIRSVIGVVTLIAATCLTFFGIAFVFRRLFGASTLFRNIVPGATITVIMVVLLAAATEAYLRLARMFPKEHRVWASEFVPGMGWRFQPGAEVRWTNGINYWTISRANSIGFLDQEPALPKPPGTLRILLVGDSFVQAVEVALEQRLSRVLAQMLQREMPQQRQQKTDVVALGYSGTGQSNQLAFYEHFKEQLNPDIVVLVFVSNDFNISRFQNWF